MSAVAGASQEPVTSPAASRKASNGTAPDKEKEKEKRYKCQFCNRAFSRSEHRSRHERSRKYCTLQASQPAIPRGGELFAPSQGGLAGLDEDLNPSLTHR
jgi:hypothetical protein